VTGPDRDADPGDEPASLQARLDCLQAELDSVRPQLDSVASELMAAQVKAQENWDLFLRARADLENYRRRVERDLGAMVRRGKQDLLLRLLGVLDSLERAAAWDDPGAGPTPPGDPAATREGFGRIQRQFLKALADEGITPLAGLGQPFDPAFHEAVDVRTDATLEVPVVTAELQKGYLWEGEVLRPARVQVTKPPE
jgi:molecular chaperone GrpE